MSAAFTPGPMRLVPRSTVGLTGSEQYLTRWDATKGFRKRQDGAIVKRVAGGYWQAYYADGQPVRCDRLSDGTPYEPRPWHDHPEIRQKLAASGSIPPARRFATAKHAMRVMDAELLAKARGEV